MATIKSFRGARYNPEKIEDLSSVISQPYDRVRHGLQDQYYERSPYNVVRIIRGKEKQRLVLAEEGSMSAYESTHPRCG
jgi:uncharacterized protein (DUF1015 family)